MTFKLDENTYWEWTGQIILYNYPDNPYVRRIWKEINIKECRNRIVEGDPVYCNDMPGELKSLVLIMGISQAEIQNKIPIENYLKEVK